jgi:hypothetical protein
MKKRLGIVMAEVAGAAGQQKVNDLTIGILGTPFPQLTHFPGI